VILGSNPELLHPAQDDVVAAVAERLAVRDHAGAADLIDRGALLVVGLVAGRSSVMPMMRSS
jgi:hypothetical protein